jgi:Flp pilus assembly protein TadD/predicted Zn-dependent protease with MMP-like domain
MPAEARARSGRRGPALGLALALAACGPGEAHLFGPDRAASASPALAAASPLPGAHEPEPREPVYVPCPAPPGDLDQNLDEASRRYDAGDWAAALSCADVAIDLAPEAVEAHHVRAAALAALERFPEAQVGFAMALALDPDDPETLAAAADFYVNVLVPKSRASIQVGFEYARRGADRAASRRRLDRRLRARLLLLEAEAENDLGASDRALPLVEEALELSPRMVEALHERGVTLFNLCRFAEAEAAFAAVLHESADDAYALHHLGLIYDRLGRREAEDHFARARSVSPSDFPEPVIISPEEFSAEVAEAVAELTPEARRALDAVSLELADLPAIDDLTAVEPPFAPTIMGLFRGLPIGEDDGHGHAAVGRPDHLLPTRAIVLYRKNLGRAVRTRRELDRQIRKTLEHELGHLAGLDEGELRRRGLE